ncbi:VOC family protein [Marinovum sp.]|uniref:VOC family protein n=1 Tax=Marinovum sp. TaxID=2024839 RepID=UPI002B2686CC|nr:VOC family protein [Marinovum sp.]
MEQRVSLITLGVQDMATTAAFYERLGWTRVEAPDCVVAFDLIGQTLGLYPLEALAEEIGVAAGTLGRGAMTLGHNLRSNEEVEDLMQRAEAAGATVLKTPQETPWGGYHGYFADPEGTIWEVAYNPFSPLADDGAFCWNGFG